MLKKRSARRGTHKRTLVPRYSTSHQRQRQDFTRRAALHFSSSNPHPCNVGASYITIAAPQGAWKLRLAKRVSRKTRSDGARWTHGECNDNVHQVLALILRHQLIPVALHALHDGVCRKDYGRELFRFHTGVGEPDVAATVGNRGTRHSI